jgi:hypothetical protein
MGTVRMFHPSSGRDNFDVVSNQATANTNNTSAGQVSQATNQNQVTAQVVDKKEIEEKTKDAIKTAVTSQSQTPPDSSTSE